MAAKAGGELGAAIRQSRGGGVREWVGLQSVNEAAGQQGPEHVCRAQRSAAAEHMQGLQASIRSSQLLT